MKSIIILYAIFFRKLGFLWRTKTLDSTVSEEKKVYTILANLT